MYPPMELETDKSLALLVSKAGVVHNVLVLTSEVNSITLLYPAYGEDVVVAEGGGCPQMLRGKTYLFGASCSVGAILASPNQGSSFVWRERHGIVRGIASPGQTIPIASPIYCALPPQQTSSE